MVSWSTVWTLTSLFGFPAYRFLSAQYYKYQAQAKNGQIPIQPVPRSIARCLNLLFVTCLLFLTLSLPLPRFTPENIFQTTQLRLFGPTNELFERLSLKRPLTSLDESLQRRLLSKDSRMLYAAYGPDAVANCPFCKSDDPSSYLYYLIPSLLWPHIFNLGVIGAVTSSGLAGPEGSRFRTQTVIGGLTLLALDLVRISKYDFTVNANARSLREVEWFYWNARTHRYIALSIFQGLLCAFLWLTSTNRLLAQPPSVSSRLQTLSKRTEQVRSHFQALVMLRNTVMRTPVLRERAVGYWAQEEQVMKELREEPEVVEAVNLALGQIPADGLQNLEQNAGGAMDELLQQLQGL